MVTATDRLQAMILNLRKCHNCAIELVSNRADWRCPKCGEDYYADSVVGYISRDSSSYSILAMSRRAATSESAGVGRTGVYR